MLQKFGPSQFELALSTFRRVGAIVWDQPILTHDSTPERWQCAHKDMVLKPNPQLYLKRKSHFSISFQLAELLKTLLHSERDHQIRGMDTPFVKTIPPHTDYGDFMLRSDWHVDSYNSITVIIPLVQFTVENGCTQLKLPATFDIPMGLSYKEYKEIYMKNEQYTEPKICNFLGEPFKPLLMNGLVYHRQSANTARSALLLQVDAAAF